MLFVIATASALPTAAGLDAPGIDRPTEDLPGVFDSSTPSESAEVVGGVREPRFGATVALVFPQLGVFCSASMITPRVALTAGHCVNEQGITPDLVEQFATVHWGPNADQPTQTTSIRKVVAHPGYGSAQGVPVNDMAIIEIEPVDYTDTIWINEEPLSDGQIGETFVSVGFGINENGESSSGRKRSADVTYDQFFSDFMVSDASSNPRQANVCSGDSGGPMYGMQSDGRFLQYAVHSWSQPPACRGLAGSTSTESFVGFILNQVESIHGSDDMCENRGANTDVYCDPGCPDDVICAVQELEGGKACQTGPTGGLGLFLLGMVGVLARRR